jgi:DNA gyrase subunit B
MSDSNLTVQTSYGVEQIDSLEGLEAVRKRPGMYIGSTSQKGVTHLVYEVADNCFDEFVAGFGDLVKIHIAKDCTVTIADKGRGIPVGPHPKWTNEDGTPMDTLTGILTKLHAGGKFNKEGSGYKVAAGLHGIGTKAVNALSDKFTAVVKRDGKIYHQEFSRGNPVTPVKVIGQCELTDTGTIISYHPDPSIFKITLEPNCKDLQARLSELASLNGGITVDYQNDITNVKKVFHYKDGIVGYVRRMAEGKQLLYDNPFHIKGNFEINKDKAIIVECAFIHDDEAEASETIKTFANNINTYEGGFHLQGFRNEYKRVVNQFGIDNKFIDEAIELKYLLDGIHAVISVKVPEAEFEGQTKTKLGNAEAQDAVEWIVRKAFDKILKNKDYAPVFESIVKRAQNVKEAEEAARRDRANKRKANKATKMALPGKLADCSNKSGYTELFLVEGDSAAGSAKQGRYREFQAILPLRGKVLNTEKAEYDKMINSDAIKMIIAALGAGVGETFDVTKVRYDKINLMTDADDDGSHIKALLLTFFYNYMPELFEKEMVYITVPPLYRVVRGKQNPVYLKDDHELREYKKKYGNKIEVQRFKGLGEMNYSQLKETTMDPQTRVLKKVTLKDAEKAAEIFNICMGKKADLRRDFIEANAYRVNLEFM